MHRAKKTWIRDDNFEICLRFFWQKLLLVSKKSITIADFCLHLVFCFHFSFVWFSYTGRPSVPDDTSEVCLAANKEGASTFKEINFQRRLLSSLGFSFLYDGAPISKKSPLYFGLFLIRRVLKKKLMVSDETSEVCLPTNKEVTFSSLLLEHTSGFSLVIFFILEECVSV